MGTGSSREMALDLSGRMEREPGAEREEGTEGEEEAGAGTRP